ncbi:MAG: DEAD/DEAH box helicase family protein [Bacilli bacterium]|nr:DEAD/DEAH box helicase family protein [Bacilli bacterium]
MQLNELNLKHSYRSNNDNMVKDFYNPVLSSAKKYKRAVGYFTLSSLINAAQGLSNLIDNGGVVQIIASPKLSEEDINTIVLGYKMKDDVVLDAMIREINDIKSPIEQERLNYIATLIADNRLDIKIAIMDDYGAYHEKFGIVEDIDENFIMFTGSMNETSSGQQSNFESFVLFKSWVENEKEFVNEYIYNFNDLWENKTNKLVIKTFPEAVKSKLLEYRKTEYVKESSDIFNIENILNENKFPEIPTWFDPRPYQIEAISNWMNNNFQGLLSMATGTGKTLTGLYGLTKLWEKTNKLVTIIVCPYQHLVEQWVEDIKKFNIDPLICYSKYSNWKNQLYRKIKLFNHGTINNFTIVTTNASFVTTEMQDFIKEIENDVFLLIDEAHNSGTDSMKKCLNSKYKYRLGLSATPKRFRDDENTQYIFDYFGGEVYSFDLERAISEGYLVKYYYYPHLVNLTSDEQEKYDELSLKIAQNIKEEKGKIIINDIAKNLLMKRSRLVAGASNKLVLLRNLMNNYQNKNFILVYCGATKSIDESDESEIRQINQVCKILGNEFGMKIRKFTADETPDEREEIIDMFSDGKSLQAIVAIKCLDEGVNIPAIQHAFVMASTTDPKEFIQRRGRVLRLYEGKEFAYIHDFITLPYDDGKEYFEGCSLVETELKRVYEFNSLAENCHSGENLIDELIQRYNIKIDKIIDAKDLFNIGGNDYED